MRIVMGCDDQSESFDRVVSHLEKLGHQVDVLERQQWPDVARRVAESVGEGAADMGVLMCWTGTGTSMMANKVRGVRAALCWEPWIADGARRWNDANVLVMSLKRTEPRQAEEIVDAWLAVEAPDPDEAENISKLTSFDRER